MHSILVTKKFSKHQLKYADILGLDPIVKPALEFKFPTYWDQVLRAITEHRQASWVLTNANAVKALKKLMDKGFQVNPQRMVYTMGMKPKKALADLGVEATIPHIQDREHLTETIIEEREKEILYFQGNLSHDSMTDHLEEAGITVKEIEVYETVLQPVEMPDISVEGILFFSPSAVEGFKRGTGFGQAPPSLFAIDRPTAEALRDETDQPVTTAGRPDTKIMLQAVSSSLSS